MLRALEAEGWMKVLFPAWNSAKADEEKLKALHDLAVELQMQGVHPDMSAAQMQLLTAKLDSKDLAALKKSLLRPDLSRSGIAWMRWPRVREGPAVQAECDAFGCLQAVHEPRSRGRSLAWIHQQKSAVQERYEQFLKVWPEARQRIPHALMQEMRITPELPELQRDCAGDLPGVD